MMNYNITDLLLIFEKIKEYDDFLEIYKLVYKKNDDLEIQFDIYGKENKLKISIKEDDTIYTECMYHYCKAIRLLDVDKKQIEILGGSVSTPYVRLFLEFEGLEGILDMVNQYEMDE